MGYTTSMILAGKMMVMRIFTKIIRTTARLAMA